jgi:autotransporter-associated beta strand protein
MSNKDSERRWHWRLSLTLLTFFLSCLWTTAVAANGTAYYLDVNGDAAGFGDPNGGVYNPSHSVWTTNALGTSATAAIGSSPQFTFGAGASDFNGASFTISSGVANWAGILVNCTNVNITMNGAGGYLAQSGHQSWTVPAGSTLTAAWTGGLNFNYANVWLSGGGVINFETPVDGNNYYGSIRQNMTDGTVNLRAGPTGNQGAYILIKGTLNFATAASSNALSAMVNNNTFTISGGTIDNTSGAGITLGRGSSINIINSNFTFKGSSALNMGTNAVDLGTAVRTITVVTNTLTIGGSVVNKGGIAKDGSGVLTLSGKNTYSGTTTVQAGTLMVEGDSSGVTNKITVNSGAAIGGTGTIGGNLVLASGAKFVLHASTALTVNGGTVDLGNLSVANLIGVDDTLALGVYTLMAGTATFNLSSAQNVGMANRYMLDGRKFAYFQQSGGSLELVVAVPMGTLFMFL